MISKTAVTFRNINRLAIPATVSGIAEPLLSITDTAIVGNIPINGMESLAAAGIVGAFLSMLIWVLGQTRSAISSIISQYLGADKLAQVKSLPAQAMSPTHTVASPVAVCASNQLLPYIVGNR